VLGRISKAGRGEIEMQIEDEQILKNEFRKSLYATRFDGRGIVLDNEDLVIRDIIAVYKRLHKAEHEDETKKLRAIIACKDKDIEKLKADEAKAVEQAKQEVARELINLLIDHDILCSEDITIKNNCLACKRVWEVLKSKFIKEEGKWQTGFGL
jgi:protein subunit release factor A